MTFAKTRTVAPLGGVIDVEATYTSGLPGLLVMGLPDKGARATQGRVWMAVHHSRRAQWPQRNVAVSLYPMSSPKLGSGHDLAIAVAVLAAAGTVPRESCAATVLLGELGLDGAVRPVAGVLPALQAAAQAGYRQALVPAGNAQEATLAAGVSVTAVSSLDQAVAHLNGQQPEGDPRAHTTEGTDAPSHGDRATPLEPVDLDALRVPLEVGRAMEVAAAGEHGIMIVGVAGSGKSLVARSLHALFPDLDRDAAMEATVIGSLARTLDPADPLITRPPLQAPHATVTQKAMIGQIRVHGVQPGAAMLAHRGVLLLDNVPDFSPQVLYALRDSLHDREVIITSSIGTFSFPARYTPVFTANYCPCGQAPASACVCTELERVQYLTRVPPSVSDHIAVKAHLGTSTTAGESVRVLADRVSEARSRARARLSGTPWGTNGNIPGPVMLRQFLPPPPLPVLDAALQAGALTPRTLIQVLQVAWTLADLEGKRFPDNSDVTEALQLHPSPTSTPQ